MKSKRPQLNHAARLAEKHFGICEHQLCIGDISIEELTSQFGTPLFIYHQDTITKTIRDLQSRLPDRFQLYYSIKANPNATILRTVLAEGCGLEIASQGELQQALAAGCEPKQILFAGPGKTTTELSAALDAGDRGNPCGVDRGGEVDQSTRWRKEISRIYFTAGQSRRYRGWSNADGRQTISVWNR